MKDNLHHRYDLRCRGFVCARREWCRLIWGVCIFLLGWNLGSVNAKGPLLRFRLSDQSWIDGQLSASDRPGHVRVKSDLFDRPLQVATTELLEARTLPGVSASPTEVDDQEFAIELTDQTQIVGRVLAWNDREVSIRSSALGTLAIETDRIRGIVTRDQMLRKILSMNRSRFRFRNEDGWSFGDSGLSCDQPGAATVGELELPDRFRIRLVIQCHGRADFEWSLGDRSAGGAGQGGRRVDRRGGSLSRMPTERFVTRVEWFDDSVALVRSNPSVSDSSVFDLGANPRRLEMTLLCDQTQGRLLAFSSGGLLAEVALADDSPLHRSGMTMINRGDPVDVERLQLFEWDGVVPASTPRQRPFTLLRSGELLPGVAQQWIDGRLVINGQSFQQGELAEMQFDRSDHDQAGSEVAFADGSRMLGHFDGSSSDGSMVFRDTIGNRLTTDTTKVVGLVGRCDAPRESELVGTRIVARGVALSGELIGGDKLGTALAWRPSRGGPDLGVVADRDVEILFAPPKGDQGSGYETGAMQLIGGEILPGHLVSVEQGAVKFQSPVVGDVAVAPRQVRRVWMGPRGELQAAELKLLLSLPRRMQQSPPTHLLVSIKGDILRGKLLSLDADQARIEVRGRIHLIPRGNLAQVVWLHQDPVTPTRCSYVATTRDGGRLGLASVRIRDGQMLGVHPVLGPCQMAIDELERFRFGGRQWNDPQRWQFIPVKEPKSFD